MSGITHQTSFLTLSIKSNPFLYRRVRSRLFYPELQLTELCLMALITSIGVRSRHQTSFLTLSIKSKPFLYKPVRSRLFGCEDAAQQVLMSVCLSVWVPSWNSFTVCNLASSRMFWTVPECSRMFWTVAECMQFHGRLQEDFRKTSGRL